MLDPFTGSGSTQIGAVRSGRSSIGVEVEPKHLQFAQQRLAREFGKLRFGEDQEVGQIRRHHSDREAPCPIVRDDLSPPLELSEPNRDQGGGKELCDVLIVFDGDIIVFSDKSCAYPDTGDPVRDWARWFKRSIRASARQVYGAERWIRHHPDRIFLDPGGERRLQVGLPPSATMRIHRGVVARGAGTRCSAFFGGDTGSLMVRSDLVGDSHVNPLAGTFCIFRIGQLAPDKGYVHVFDDANLDIVLSELDTVADFVGYLTRKEAFLRSGRVVLATGEEDLLAHYLTHTNDNGEHDFVVPAHADVIEFDHLYRGMPEDAQYIAKKSADKISYLIDDLIEHVTRSATDCALIADNELPVRDYEKALRVLAGENRLSRRHLARALLDLLSSSRHSGRPKSRCVVRAEKSGTGYCLLVCPCPQDRDYEQHRRWRSQLLTAYCNVLKSRFPDLEHIIGYATEPVDGERRSEDLVYVDTTNLTEEDTQTARRIQRESGLLTSPTVTHVHEAEYPASSGPEVSDSPLA